MYWQRRFAPQLLQLAANMRVAVQWKMLEHNLGEWELKEIIEYFDVSMFWNVDERMPD